MLTHEKVCVRIDEVRYFELKKYLKVQSFHTGLSKMKFCLLRRFRRSKDTKGRVQCPWSNVASWYWRELVQQEEHPELLTWRQRLYGFTEEVSPLAIFLPLQIIHFHPGPWSGGESWQRADYTLPFMAWLYTTNRKQANTHSEWWVKGRKRVCG